MSNLYNRDFETNTESFIETRFISALRLPKLDEGHLPFNLRRHLSGAEEIVTLETWTPDCDEMPLFGYWVPQGGSCVVPAHPTRGRFVLTPDFSGCSIMVDQIDASSYRVYHVQGGSNYMETEYINSGLGHGLGLAGSLTFSDYGTSTQPRAFAFLKYEGGRWWIHYQSQTGFGLSYNTSSGSFIAIGQQAVRGGGKKPVADLTAEQPHPSNAAHAS